MELDAVRPWDAECDPLGRPPLHPFDTTDRLVKGCHNIFTNVDGQLGSWFARMMDLGLLDLDSRKGKGPGGYQQDLPEARVPFIFANTVGVNDDVFTMLHEGGHAFHCFAVHDEQLVSYRHAPMEFSEGRGRCGAHNSHRTDPQSRTASVVRDH
jgi:oligoendopeptidase F